MKADYDRRQSAPILLVADGGQPHTIPASADPIADWLDLMETVEALCFEWPAPDSPAAGFDYRL